MVLGDLVFVNIQQLNDRFTTAFGLDDVAGGIALNLDEAKLQTWCDGG
jgi:hypothetical protein